MWLGLSVGESGVGVTGTGLVKITRSEDPLLLLNEAPSRARARSRIIVGVRARLLGACVRVAVRATHP